MLLTSLANIPVISRKERKWTFRFSIRSVLRSNLLYLNWPLKAGDLFNFLPVMVTDLISQIAMRINWRVVNRQYLINLVTADHQLTNKSASISSKYLGSQCMVMGLYQLLWIMGSKRWKLRTQDNIIIQLQTCSWPNALLIVHILTDILKYRNWSWWIYNTLVNGHKIESH